MGQLLQLALCQVSLSNSRSRSHCGSVIGKTAGKLALLHPEAQRQVLSLTFDCQPPVATEYHCGSREMSEDKMSLVSVMTVETGAGKIK